MTVFARRLETAAFVAVLLIFLSLSLAMIFHTIKPDPEYRPDLTVPPSAYLCVKSDNCYIVAR